MDAISKKKSVFSAVDQIGARASRVARVIGDELDQRRAQVRRGGQELSHDAPMANARRRADDEGKVVAPRGRDASEDEVGDHRKRQPSVHVGKRRAVSAEAGQQRLGVDVHFNEHARKLNQNANALERRPVVERRQSRGALRLERASPLRRSVDHPWAAHRHVEFVPGRDVHIVVKCQDFRVKRP